VVLKIQDGKIKAIEGARGELERRAFAREPIDLPERIEAISLAGTWSWAGIAIEVCI
jgi:hypothetical protein